MPLEPRARIRDVLLGHARLVGSRTRVGRDDLGLPRGVVSPYELRTRVGLRYGDPPLEEAKHERERTPMRDAATALRWLALRVLTPRRTQTVAVARPFVVSSRVDALDTREVVERVIGWLRAGESRRAFFVHPHALNIAAEDEGFRRDLAAADLVLPDGIGIRVAARILRTGLPANVNGTDLVPELLLELAAEGLSVALVGAAPGVAARAAGAWQARTGVKVAGTWDGFGDDDAMRAAARSIAAGAPCVVLVGMGSPIQERVALRYFADLPGVVTMTVGGLFDFVAGNQPRAPQALRELGLEWVWRLAHEPRRLGRRYLAGNPVFIARAIAQRLASEWRSGR
jgi:N-acetylglucosaminyldiphosphoundecaprenol N-acetyl-beta-D-mannosaminyltransferase